MLGMISMNNNLPLLKDIHLPEDALIFPLGYGWLLLLALLLLSYWLFKLFKIIQSKSKKYYALHLLKAAKNNDVPSAIKISELLRRVCLYKYKDAVSLFGDEWIAFLNMHCKKKIAGNAAKLLIYAPYLPKNKVFDIADYEELKKYVKCWIGENL